MTAAAIPSKTSITEKNFNLLVPSSWGNYWVVAGVSAAHVVAIWALHTAMQKGMLKPAETVVPIKVSIQMVQPPKPIPLPAASPPPSPPVALPVPQPAVLPPPAKPVEVKTKPEPAKPEPQKQTEPPILAVEATKPAVATPAAPSPTPPASSISPTAESVITSVNSAAPTGATASANTGFSRTGTSPSTSVSASPAPAPTKATKVLPTTSYASELRDAKPPYPRMSRTMGEQGSVLVQILIGADGLPKKAELGKSSGFDRLDQAALSFAMQERFNPGSFDGVPSEMVMGKTYIFDLTK